MPQGVCQAPESSFRQKKGLAEARERGGRGAGGALAVLCLTSPPVSAVAGGISLVAMARPVVGVVPLGPLIPAVVALLPILARVLGVLPFPRTAAGPRRAAAAGLPGFGRGVLVSLVLLVASHLGTLVTGGGVAELVGRRIAAAPRTAVRLGAAGGGIAFTFPGRGGGTEKRKTAYLSLPSKKAPPGQILKTFKN